MHNIILQQFVDGTMAVQLLQMCEDVKFNYVMVTMMTVLGLTS